MPDAGQNGHGNQAAQQEKQPIEGESEQGGARAEPDAPDEEERQPTRERPFVAELKKQQQREHHRAGAAKVFERLPKRRMRRGRSPGKSDPDVENRENS